MANPEAQEILSGGHGGPVHKHRGVLHVLRRAVTQGAMVADDQLRKAVAYADTVLDDPKATTRDKQAACNFVQAIVSKSLDVAMHLDKVDVGEEEQHSGPVTVIVQRVQRPLCAGDAAALSRGTAEDDRPRATIQRGDVRAQVGEDDDGGMSGG